MAKKRKWWNKIKKRRKSGIYRFFEVRNAINAKQAKQKEILKNNKTKNLPLWNIYLITNTVIILNLRNF